MLKLIKYFPFLRNKTIKLIPVRNFNVSQSYLNGHPFSKKPFRRACELPCEKLHPKNVYKFFQRIQKVDCVSLQDVKSEKFEKFLNEAKPIIIHQMTGPEILQVLLGIIHNHSLVNHEISNGAVNSLISKIKDVPFHDLAFLDYRIQRRNLNDFYKELRLKIQMIYLLKTDELLDNCGDFMKTKQVFDYMRNNVDIVSPNALNRLAICLMQTDMTRFDINDVMRAIVLFSQFNDLNEQSIQTLNKMISLWREHNPQFRDVELLLSLISYSNKINKYALEDAGLIQFLFEFLENKCEERTLGCFQSLIEMGFWQQSIDSMSHLFERGIFHSNVHFFIELCGACEKYKYTPANWKTIIMPALEKFDFRKYITKHEKFDWIRFAVELHSLDHTDIVLIEALLKLPKYLNSPNAEKLEDILKEKRGFATEGAALAKYKKSHRISSQLPSESEDMDPKDVVKFFRGLEAMKDVSADDVQKPEFQSFLSRTMQTIHQMAGSEILDIMIGIIHHEQLRKHPVANCVKDALIPKIRNLEFKEMAFLDYIIQKKKLNSTYGRLRKKIQKTFLKNDDRILDECNEFDNLLTTAIYMRDNANIVSARVLKRFSHYVMITDGPYKIDDITDILVLFSQFNYLEEQPIEALNKMVKMWCDLKPKFRDVQLLLSLFKTNKNQDKMDKQAFENSGLIEFIFDSLNRSDDSQTIGCFSNLIKMGYWRESIESMSKCFENGTVKSNDANGYIALCLACDKHKLKPLNWQSTILPMLKSFDFRPHIVCRKEFDWPRFILTLHSLGYNDFGSIEALLKSEKFKNSQHLEKLNNILMKETPDEVYSSKDCFDSESHLELINALLSKKSLQQGLEGIIGKEFILCDYEVSENFKVPFITKVDFNEEKFIPINKSNITESLKANEKLIGIFVVDDEDTWMQLKELLEIVDIGEMDLNFTKISPERWLSNEMCVLPNDVRRDIWLQEIVAFLRKKVKRNYSY